MWQLLGGADNATATLVAGYAITLGIREIYRRTIGRRRHFTSCLNRLTVGVNPEYARSILGAPTFGLVDPEGNGRLIWFMHDMGFVGAQFNEGRARRVEFTVTNHRLRFDVERFTLGITSGILGHQTFESMGSSITGRCFSVGARRILYSEAHYLGNPGGYLTCFLTFNDASHLGRLGPFSEVPPGAQDENCLDPKAIEFLETLRSQARPNCVAITDQSPDDGYWPLSDNDEVRLLRWNEPQPRNRP